MATLMASSGSSLIAQELIAQKAVARGSSGASMNIVVTEELDAEMSSGASLTYSGNPVIKNINTSSGGNINKIFSISKRKDGKPLTLELLKDYYKELNASTVEERMHLYNLRQDRADVIVPALQIYTSVMRWAWAEEIYVPKIGLADGLIKVMYKERLALMK